MTAKKVYWIGSLVEFCQICARNLDKVMYDASVGGPWGNICQKCFDDCGCRLGTGFGQKYEKQKDGRWLKTGG